MGERLQSYVEPFLRKTPERTLLRVLRLPRACHVYIEVSHRAISLQVTEPHCCACHMKWTTCSALTLPFGFDPLQNATCHVFGMFAFAFGPCPKRGPGIARSVSSLGTRSASTPQPPEEQRHMDQAAQVQIPGLPLQWLRSFYQSKGASIKPYLHFG